MERNGSRYRIACSAVAIQRMNVSAIINLYLDSTESDITKLKTIDLVRKELTEETFDEVYQQYVGEYGAAIPNEAYRKETSVGGLMEFAGNVVTDIFGGQLGKTLPLNKNENAELNIFLPSSDTFNSISMGMKIAAPILSLIPQFNVHGTPLGRWGRRSVWWYWVKAAAEALIQIATKVANAFYKHVTIAPLKWLVTIAALKTM